ncbi:MAG: hypothetical protein QM501_08770, partial [Gimesia sp.]
SPSRLFFTSTLRSIFGLLVVTAFVAETFTRDYHFQTEEFILSTAVGKPLYLGARFMASSLVALLAFSCSIIGMILGGLMPGLNPFALGPFRLDAYLMIFLTIILPNLLTASVISFAIAARTRSMTITYAGAIVLVMLYFASLIMVGVDAISYDHFFWWALLDPFGFYAYESTTLNWNVFQRNHQLPDFSGVFLWNRLVWLGLSSLIWWVSYRWFELRSMPSVFSGKKQSGIDRQHQPAKTSIQRGSAPVFQTSKFTWHGFCRQWWCRSWFDIRSIYRGNAFLLLTGFGLLSLVLACIGRRSYNFTNPSTDILIHVSYVYLEYILFLIVILYAVELIWRDQRLKVKEVLDSTPVSNAVIILSNTTALFCMITVYLMLAVVVLVGYQTLKGYHHYDFPLYFQMLFLEHSPYYYLTAILALFSQVITRHKYAGIALVVLIVFSSVPLNAFELYHNLYHWAGMNDIEYSPMNGYGRLFTAHLWYLLYWGLFSSLLLVLTCLFRTREIPEHISRWRQWKQTGRQVKYLVGGLALAWCCTGGWIFYNTTILNRYQPLGKNATSAEIEKRYQQYEHLPMPVVTATKVKVELYPDQNFFEADGEYRIENRTNELIHELHMLTFIHLQLSDVSCQGLTLRESDRQHGYYIYDLDPPLRPDEQRTLKFSTSIQMPQGFRNQSDADDVYMIYPNDVAGNGTNLYSPFILPFIGYTKMAEHKKDWQRFKYDLPPLAQRMRGHDDPEGLKKGLMLSHLTWGQLDVTIGTSHDQTAVCCGRLVKHWTESGRNYFHYRTEKQSRGKFTIYSGRYETRTDKRFSVPIEVYFHPRHRKNVDLILEQTGDMLEFYESAFGPCPFTRLRIVEFAYYDNDVYTQGGTIGIPEVLVWKSESYGQGKNNIQEWLAYLLARCWFEDQLIVADMAGGMTIVEALSEYASQLYLGQIRTRSEQQAAKQFLMREFFRKLGKVDYQEPALQDVYNELLIARRKGGMILNLIEELIGQQAVLKGINQFLDQYRFHDAPYPSVLNLRDALIAAAPESVAVIRDLFSQILTFQIELKSATVRQTDRGEYQVTLQIEANQLKTSGLGEQEKQKLSIPVRIELTDDRGDSIYSEQHDLKSVSSEIKIEVSTLPVDAVVDPDYRYPQPFMFSNKKHIRKSTEPERFRNDREK